MTPPEWLLRAGFPYLKTIGMRRVTTNCVDVAFGAQDRVHVLLRSAIQTEIVTLSFDDDVLGTMSGLGTDEGKLQWPVQVIADSEGSLYVSDEALDRISAFTEAGELVGCWGQSGGADGQMSRPSGIAFDPDENIYVADTLNHRIQKFTKDGRFLSTWGAFGDGPGEFNMPWGVAVDEVGDVYVSDWRNDRIQKLTADGEPIFSFGRAGAGDGAFNRPAGVAVDRDGDIYVADRDNNRVQLFDRRGRYVEKFIGDATLSKQGRHYIMANAVTLRLRDEAGLERNKLFRGPASVRVKDDLMFVPDYGSHRVQIYRKESYPLDSTQIAPVPRSPRLQTT